MDLAAPVALGAAVLCLVLGVLLGLLVTGRRTRLAAAEARAQVDELRARLDRMAEQLEQVPPSVRPSDVPLGNAEYVITGLPAIGAEPGPEPREVGDRAVLSVTFGEPLVKVVSFGYGVRRALSAESRNRIAFEMRRELKRARRERRRGTRRARREAAA